MTAAREERDEAFVGEEKVEAEGFELAEEDPEDIAEHGDEPGPGG